MAGIGRLGCPLIGLESLNKVKPFPVREVADGREAGGPKSLERWPATLDLTDQVFGRTSSRKQRTEAHRCARLDCDDTAAAAKQTVTLVQPVRGPVALAFGDRRHVVNDDRIERGVVIWQTTLRDDAEVHQSAGVGHCAPDPNRGIVVGDNDGGRSRKAGLRRDQSN